MDRVQYGIWLKALWGVPAIVRAIDMDAMLKEARWVGSEADILLIESLIKLKSEDHRP